MLRGLAIFALLLSITQVSGLASGQTSDHPGVNRQASPASTSPGVTPITAAAATGASGTTGKTDCNGAPCEEQQPRVIVSVPPPAPVVWALHDRIAWAANLVLAVLGYVGIMVALSTLKKIERQTRSAEVSAAAAFETAQAALLNAQTIIDAERPWLSVTVEPSPGVESGFEVVVSNRGRSPARIVSTAERMAFAKDESHLSLPPEYRREEPATTPQSPIILVPGESTTILKFCRDDLKVLCQTPERLKRVENWEEKLFLYGKVEYRDLLAQADKQIHETAWCCWYIHGRQKSGLVIAGPPEYNLHT